MASLESSPYPTSSLPSPSSKSSPLLLSDEKFPLAPHQRAPSAFENLPDEIIQQILQLTDPGSFASLVLLNSKWRRISQQAHLYAHQLMRCHSYATSHPPIAATAISDQNLPNLRRLFAREVKRNLFEAYLRPNKTTIKLISNSISSSSAPGGEGMQFSPSPRGHHLLAYNSSRIYVLDLRCASLVVRRELKILRRPVSACIVDDGSFLAVLSTDMQIDLYDLKQSPPRREQSFILDNTPRAISFSPCGNVLATAYEGGIEVSSLRAGAFSTDRRSVKCDGVDSLAFSLDGTQLLGTTTASTTPNTVILTAPYYDPGSQLAKDDISALWTTSILFPNASRDCSHAVLIQESSSMEAAWTFTYDRSFETFRAVRVDDLRNGTTYFTGPVPTASSPDPLLPCTLPAANYQGELVSAGFEGKNIWLYGIPEDLEAVPEVNHVVESSTLNTLNRRSSSRSARSPSQIQRADGFRVPQWQILCDKLRNTFISGRMIAEMAGVSNVKWVSGFGESSLQERLVITAKGIVPHRLINEEEGIDFLDGGRITILDFNYGLENGGEQEITIEVGTMVPEALEEEHRDIDTEVAIVRRRTVAQRRGNQGGVMHAATTINRQAEALLRISVAEAELEDPLIPRRMITATDHLRPPVSEGLDDVSLEEAQEALDAPYTHASPRSGTTLRRAATAAAVNRQRNPPPPTAGHVEYRRADGRAEHPHESDADNWVPPPPPYSKEDPVVDLPSYLRHTLIPGVGLATQHLITPDIPPVPPLPPVLSTTQFPLPDVTAATNRPELSRIRTSVCEGRPRQGSMGSVVSQQTSSETYQNRDGTNARTSSAITNGELRRDRVDDEDIYDASPIQTPSPEDPLASGSEWMSIVTPRDERLSAGSKSFSTEHTSGSSRSLHLDEDVDSDSIQPHGIAFENSSTASNPVPRDRTANDKGLGGSLFVDRLPNSSTWPRVSGKTIVRPVSTLTDYPRSAPAIDRRNNEELVSASLSLRAKSRQIVGLRHGQSSTEAPWPLPGNIESTQMDRGSDSGRDHGCNELHQRPPSPPEQPFIISTPSGIVGINDEAQLSIASSTDGPVLHAPVPRHPRQAPGDPLNRPTAERLETLTSERSRTEPIFHSETFEIPPSSSYSFFRRRSSVSRRPSRARRGALKNLQDARDRGWKARKKKKDKENDGASWTDIPSSNGLRYETKDKKCVVM
ncbi:hypothetical protein GGS21DRAFT_84998 [Xylaria nigripes]|nr:hypothetical protein GGS21DRAFT_84998 [Xylaria nigripes]